MLERILFGLDAYGQGFVITPFPQRDDVPYWIAARGHAAARWQASHQGPPPPLLDPI
jgi:hypothetical protein